MVLLTVLSRLSRSRLAGVVPLRSAHRACRLTIMVLVDLIDYRLCEFRASVGTETASWLSTMILPRLGRPPVHH